MTDAKSSSDDQREGAAQTQVSEGACPGQVGALARVVAQRLVAYRRRENINQTELAERLGVSQPGVSRLERAATTPSVDSIARIAALIGTEFTISIVPAHRTPTQITDDAYRDAIGTYEEAGARVRISAT